MNLVWLRRELRLEDNRLLIAAAKEDKPTLIVFIFDEHSNNSARVNNFLYTALKDLDQKLSSIHNVNIALFHGSSPDILLDLVKKHRIEKIFHGDSLSSFEKQQVSQLEDYAFDNFFDIYPIQDSLLVPSKLIPDRKVFSAFYRLWEKVSKDEPDYSEISLKSIEHKYDLDKTKIELSLEEESYWTPKLLNRLISRNDYSDYDEFRDFPSKSVATNWSVFLRYGLISSRQAWEILNSQSQDLEKLKKELAWREFWFFIMERFPNTLREEFQEKRRNLNWIQNEEWLLAWQEGKTGYPIIDAAMRQLNQEGWICNRLRMVVASFLTKDLCLDWRLGEQYFATQLLDYEEAVNIGNWQWTASVGADPRPVRIFSPIRQGQRFDPEAEYILNYVPELSKHEAFEILDPISCQLDYYPPIVNHAEMRNVAKDILYSYRD